MSALPSMKHNNPPSELLPVFEPFIARIEELKKIDANTQFDYESKEGNKAARSYVHSLRKEKTAVEQARKAEKDASLQYGRRVDAEAAEVTKPIEYIIARHDSKLTEIETKEKERIAEIKLRIENITTLGNSIYGFKSDTLKQNLEAVSMDAEAEVYGEYTPVAQAALERAREAIKTAIETAEKHEAEMIELAEARKRLAENERLERERLAKEEAEARIQRAAEAKIEQERREAAAREQKLKDDLLRAEREKQEAIEAEKRRLDLEEKRIAQAKIDEEARQKAEAERVEREKQAAIEAERKRIADEQEALRIQQEKERAAEEKRQANKKHRDTIHEAATKAIYDAIDGDCAALKIEALVIAISEGKIPRVFIDYSTGEK